MAEQVLTEAARKMVADRATGVENPASLDTALVYLYTVQIVPQPTTTVDDLTQATFPGYAPSSLVAWDTALIDPASVITVSGDEKEFVCDDVVDVPETIYGAFLAVPSAGPAFTPETLLAVTPFDVPVGISRAGQGVRHRPSFIYP